MKAVQIEEFGGPEVLQVVDLPVPVPADDEVLIRVTRAGLNFADTHQRHNQYVEARELPLIPGVEVAGVREDTGERVVALCGNGGYAEYATAPAPLTFPIPGGVTDEQALAVIMQGLTAWHLYRTFGRVAPGESVVVGSAAGGVGSLAVQLGYAEGARVIATASNAEKRALALELGADTAIDGAPEGLKDRLIEANGGAPVDVVFEMAGGRVFEESYDALAPLGRLVVYGVASREQNEIRTGKLMRTNRQVIGFWIQPLLERPELVGPPLQDLFGRIARGELRVVVGATYPLSAAAEAQLALAERRSTGKLLLDPTA
ncbi:MAG: NADPH:quinone oxidoreductase family protein [Solirubrobacteraceae bacterium]|nr:NADPH:quinone oxidoreductase family protein [Solirubrobacteraceae bacterium]